MNNENNKGVLIRPYTLKELASLYGVGWRTLKRWLVPFREEIGEKNGRYFSIPQVKKIFEKIDYPTFSSEK